MIDLVLVNGLPGSGKTTLATGLAPVLGAPLVSKDVIKEAVAEIVPATPGHALGMAASEMMWTLAAAMSGNVMLESWWFKPRDLHFVEAGLRRCGPANVVEVWCDVPACVAKGRYAARQRHRIREALPRAARMSHDRLCTPSRGRSSSVPRSTPAPGRRQPASRWGRCLA